MLGALLLLFLFPQLHPPQCHFQPFSCPGRSTLTSRCEKAWRTLEPFHQDREALRAAELPHRSKIQPKFLLNEPCGSLMCVFGRTTESLRLEKTSRIIKSSCVCGKTCLYDAQKQNRRGGAVSTDMWPGELCTAGSGLKRRRQHLPSMKARGIHGDNDPSRSGDTMDSQEGQICPTVGHTSMSPNPTPPSPVQPRAPKKPSALHGHTQSTWRKEKEARSRSFPRQTNTPATKRGEKCERWQQYLQSAITSSISWAARDSSSPGAPLALSARWTRSRLAS